MEIKFIIKRNRWKAFFYRSVKNSPNITKEWDKALFLCHSLHSKLETQSLFISRPPDKSAYWKNVFFISYPKHTVSFEHPKHMFKLMGNEIIRLYANKNSLSGPMHIYVFLFNCTTVGTVLDSIITSALTVKELRALILIPSR